jgi:flagellar biosynthesis/type III secretory pathway chaperone
MKMYMSLINEFIETLERLSAVYDELFETAKEKQRYLISGNIEGLETLLYQEKNQTEIAQLLEEKRQNIIKRYSKEHDIQDTITIHSLMDRIDHTYSKKISTLIDKLTHVIKLLQDLNEVNASLIHYSLEITDDILKMFCPSALQYPVYQHTGKMLGNELSRALIDTEI